MNEGTKNISDREFLSRLRAKGLDDLRAEGGGSETIELRYSLRDYLLSASDSLNDLEASINMLTERLVFVLRSSEPHPDNAAPFEKMFTQPRCPAADDVVALIGRIRDLKMRMMYINANLDLPQ